MQQKRTFLWKYVLDPPYCAMVTLETAEAYWLANCFFIQITTHCNWGCLGYCGHHLTKNIALGERTAWRQGRTHFHGSQDRPTYRGLTVSFKLCYRCAIEALRVASFG